MNESVFGPLKSFETRASRLRESRRGVRHQGMLEPLIPGAGCTPILTVKVELDIRVDGVECILLEPEKAKLPLRYVRTEWDALNWAYAQVWQATLPARTPGTLVRYQVGAHTASSGMVMADGGATFSYLVGDGGAPAWAQDAVIYQIFPDRFHPGAGRSWNKTADLEGIHGGTLRGIVEQVDTLADLGFNCIWLNPFFPDHTHHGYHATDYFSVNPRLGTLDDMRELVDRAHDSGIRLLLDFVANHWGSRHPAFQEALADRNSEYFDWFHWIDWPHWYETYYDVKDLPRLNAAHPGVRKYLVDSALYWLTEIGFDGLRLDHANGLPQDFWTVFRSIIKSKKPDTWMFGEVVDSPDEQLHYSGRLDGCLDFLLAQKLRDTFASGSMTFAELDGFLHAHERFFPQSFSRPSFLDNHDMNRFLFIAGGDQRRLKSAALCQFTLPGPPIVYYGTEVGVKQERAIHARNSRGMVEARQPMAWGEEQDRELREYYRWLIHFRREHPVLASGRRETIHLDEGGNTYAYLRSDDRETVIVAFNLSADTRIVEAGDHTFTLAPISGDVRVMSHQAA